MPMRMRSGLSDLALATIFEIVGLSGYENCGLHAISPKPIDEDG